MDTQLKTQLTTIANIDISKVFKDCPLSFLHDTLKTQAEEAKEVITEHSFISVSKNPVKVICSPCGNLYIEEFVTDENDQVVNVVTTSSYNKAQQVCATWAECNAKEFKNGNGEPYKALTVKEAAIQAGEKIVSSFKLYLDDKANDLTDYLDVSLWSGDTERVETKL